eukprot:scaffold252127_cov20-Tisochrysis_lutea.AAC.1
MSLMFGMVALTATKRTDPMGSCMGREAGAANEEQDPPGKALQRQLRAFKDTCRQAGLQVSLRAQTHST